MFKTDKSLCYDCTGEDCATCYKGSGYFKQPKIKFTEETTLKNTDDVPTVNDVRKALNAIRKQTDKLQEFVKFAQEHSGIATQAMFQAFRQDTYNLADDLSVVSRDLRYLAES